MNASLTSIYNKVTAGIFNKKKANPNSAKVVAGDIADILYDILNYADTLPADKFKGQWAAGAKTPGEFWVSGGKIWRWNRQTAGLPTAGTDSTAPTVPNADWELVFAPAVPPIRYTIPFGPHTSAQVPFVHTTTVTLLRKFGEVATLQYKIGPAGDLGTVAFTEGISTQHLTIPAGSYLELFVGWGSLPSGKGSVYLEALEVQ